MEYGLLASLGIEKGKPFNPDSRMQGILVKAAQIANDQMRVQSFADRRPDRMAWPDRKWEWATLRPENGTFDLPSYKDLDARTKWFYQAQIESPAMFRRTAAAGSLYWLGTRDSSGAFLDGGKSLQAHCPPARPCKTLLVSHHLRPRHAQRDRYRPGQGCPPLLVRAQRQDR